MSDEGERGARWTEMTDDMAATEDRTDPSPSDSDGGSDERRPPRSFELPEIEVPAPTGRTEFSEPSGAEEEPEEAAGGADPRDGATVGGEGSADERERPVQESEDDRDARPRPNPWFERPARPAAASGEDAETAADAKAVADAEDAKDAPRREPRGEETGPVAASTPTAETAEPEGAGEGDGGAAVAASLRGEESPAGPAEPGDVRVAPAVTADEDERADRPAEERPAGWEGSLFDGGGDRGGGVDNYAPVEMPGANAPVRPGKPSSGNWRLPDWIDDEEQRAGEGRGGDSAGFEEEGRSRLGLYAGVGLLLIALVAAGGVFFLKRDGSGSDPAPADSGQSVPSPVGAPVDQQVEVPPDKAMPRFPGTPTRRVGMVVDRTSGLAWPRFGPPWRLPTKQNRLAVKGWSGQQVVVTERRGNRIWYGQLLTGGLQPALVSHYTGPDSLKQVTALALDDLLKRYYGFPHTARPVASQALTVGGRRGWMIGTRLSYRRPGVRATGELVAVAVIDTGRRTPALVFASVPNTHRKLYPDITAFLTGLRPVRPSTE